MSKCSARFRSSFRLGKWTRACSAKSRAPASNGKSVDPPNMPKPRSPHMERSPMRTHSNWMFPSAEPR
eukprot:3166640-Alexandrium_andersonii.AAC.1